MSDLVLSPRENPHLLLLSHYGQLGAEDRTAWQDRLMQLEGVDREQLTVLHGLLIASDWIEQNTGRAQLRPDRTISDCYRITTNGLREYRRLQGLDPVEEPSEALEKPQPRVPRKRKDKDKSQNQTDAVAAPE